MLENRSGSASPSSPSMPSSDESYASSGEMEASTEIYEYAVCSGISCCFKFCVKCDCKYHPRQKCKDLSPVSPQRSYLSKSSVACSQKSKKSLKRLFNWFFPIHFKHFRLDFFLFQGGGARYFHIFIFFFWIETRFYFHLFQHDFFRATVKNLKRRWRSTLCKTCTKRISYCIQALFNRINIISRLKVRIFYCL